MSSATADRPRALAALGVLTVLCAWATYLPLGIKYGVTLCMGAAAAIVVWRNRCRAVPELRALAVAAPLGGLWLLLAASATWSTAPARLVASHLGIYALILLVPLIAVACPPARAKRALTHFATASVIVGGLFILRAAGSLPPWPLWGLTIDEDGNQRICNSILLALGSALCLWHAAAPGQTAARTAAWCGGTALAVVGLALQDRRTGMLVLPVILLAWSMARQPGLWRRLSLVVALVAAAALTWQLSDGVRQRFAEGVAELRAYPGDDSVSTSWGQRLRLLEVTATMVSERPLLGAGVASWDAAWRSRVQAGSAVADNRTPHNEYLHLAQQAGFGAAGLLAWAVVAGLRTGWRAGRNGMPALLAWATLGFSGLFNAVLRDAKFALPLIVLCALSMALARSRDVDIDVRSPAQPGLSQL